MKTTTFLSAMAVALAGLLSLASGAAAHQFTPYVLQGHFDGHDSTGGAFSPSLQALTIDQETGNVYVVDQHGTEAEVSQFDAAGNAVQFPALANSSTIFTGNAGFQPGTIQWDWTPFHGGLYVNAGGLSAYKVDGSKRWGPTFSGGDVSPTYPDGSILRTSSNFRRASNGAEVPAVQVEQLYEGGIDRFELGADGFFYFSRNESGDPGVYKGQEMSPNCEPISYPYTIECERVYRFTYASPRELTLDRAAGHMYVVEPPFNHITEYDTSDGRLMESFGFPEGAFAGLSQARGIAVNEATKDVYVTSLDGGPRVDVFHPGPAYTVPDVTTVPAEHPDDTSAVLKAVVNADNVPTTECKFEWGPTTQYTNTIATEGVPCEQGNVLSGSEDHTVTLHVDSLTVGGVYHFRVAARNADGYWTYGADRVFEGSTPPTAPGVLVDRVNTDSARFTAEVDPHGGTTSYHFEIGTQDCASNPCQSIPATDRKLSSRISIGTAQATAQDLKPDTTYYVRLVASNGAGSATPSAKFHTFPGPPTKDPCSNAQVRQQTSAYLLPDCRAYELVSAANAGGYDVESTIVPNQTPYSAYPDATGRLLYGLHFGSLPGVAGSPTNYGLDPYVAERGEDGWTSRYVGIPANSMPDPDAYGSPLLAADDQLTDFAFGGTGICNPCFAGHGTNIPVRLQGGPPTPGMAGAKDPGTDAPAGYVGRYLSADGTHLVFGSTKKYEEGATEGALTIYERDLGAGLTEIVSRDQSGSVFGGPGTASLDVSSNGLRVVVGKLVSTDAAGNHHYHLYMHLAGSDQSADLTPGAGSSALFAGMTADGSRVFFTTADELVPADTDASVDVYEAAVDQGGAVALRLVSTDSAGAPRNDDSCTPVGTPTSWNSVSGPGSCDAIAPAGGAGVAVDRGTFYFFSPEQLEGSEGEPGEPNLYVVRPGQAPRFAATIDSSVGKPGQPPAQHPLVNANFASATSGEAMTVDQSTGDVYVLQQGEGELTRFDSTGAPKEFSATGTNSISGFNLGPGLADVAIDNAPGSPLAGDIYVASGLSVTVWSPDGNKLGEITGSGTPNGYFYSCGAAVDQAGSLYVSDAEGYIWKFAQNSPSGELTNGDYTRTGIQTTGFAPCASAEDGNGHLFVSGYPNGPMRRFSTAAFAAGTPPGQSGSLVAPVSTGVETDTATHEAFVDDGNQIHVIDAAGKEVSTISGSGAFSGSRGIAVRSSAGPSQHHVYVSAKAAGTISEFGYAIPPYVPIDNPAVVNGVHDAATHRFGDFQVTRNGDFAAFESSRSLTGYQNLGHPEIFRWDAEAERLDCASCASTLAPAQAGASLSSYGLNLSSDGRVFFTTDEGLVLSDTNEKSDAYEWNEGAIGILSSGRGLDDSALLSASEDGKDAFFFTRDVLVPEDENGGAVKIYDAREGGGFLHLPISPPCAASDECHGAGSQPPPPPNVNSYEGPGNSGYGPPPGQKKCKKGFHRRKGKCVRGHRRHHRHGHGPTHG